MKAEIAQELSALGIDTRPFFHPLTAIPAFRNHPQAKSGRQDNPVGYAVSARAINLPSALALDQDMVERVAEALHAVFDAPRSAATPG
jgi:perosamine synthetase